MHKVEDQVIMSQPLVHNISTVSSF
jgi:hypothetical protein